MGAIVLSRRPKGFGAFAMIWSSQVLSILASGMTGFALTIWMYQQTQSATAMAAVQLCFSIPFMVMSFFSGPMIDRYSRKLMMSLSDIASAVGTFAITVAFLTGTMSPWIIYAASVIMGIGLAFQWPAFSATISLIVPKEHLGRVNGMMTLLEAGPAVFAPLLAGALMPFIGITGILFIDISTFVLAVATLFYVDIPNPPKSAEGEKAKGNIVSEALWGFRYIFERPSLLGLQILLLAGNTAAGFAGTLYAPMILARTGADSVLFGGIQTIVAIGGVVGGIILSVWGGFKRKTIGIVVGWGVSGFAGGLLFGLSGSFWMWAASGALAFVFMPLINASNQSIWMSKVAPDMQGRVFSARRMIAQITSPIVPMIAGPLADFVFEPSMSDPSSGLARIFSPLFGTGPGIGMSVIIALSGIATMLVAAVGWAVPCIRNAEKLLPDAVIEPQPESVEADEGSGVVAAFSTDEDTTPARENAVPEPYAETVEAS